ncbi:hypothetical protein XFF7766_280035 [Xanthomonas citri pv. fuscans]|nr:hypothetical protein XFF7766_280035 [Xanthomonas citri pv. fuscans]
MALRSVVAVAPHRVMSMPPRPVSSIAEGHAPALKGRPVARRLKGRVAQTLTRSQAQKRAFALRLPVCPLPRRFFDRSSYRFTAQGTQRSNWTHQQQEDRHEHPESRAPATSRAKAGEDI